ncbi:hypothetical protein A2803_03520 [Candidatus Woesebacteria bacterium RIFCSPHIGHO2_01_FULL_44_21]|uniref:NYN domain-containing protein n=1 Tax=Candidatus Woesebacteria bacterium RIFCSPHIGHO2_01_FULL_44_21 TaxID=1802503 RepID=A0A1F7Z0M6_9BACT|nr:MAG: hypothetical protein A2803_03520 [Candidatus Woesebacteria bacterium RIFCSPHIGHO2_01_FULL_44_21]OGM69102.1 MAG: hypothetical protein A2897_04720 [Candidatus Woesebacteria bacterium RIFCSPLOWO2_01_FULL_44_24b]
MLKVAKAYHKKGVDVNIATRLLVGAFRDKYDTAYLISSDSDLIPAVSECQAAGKTICYIGFQAKPSYALLKTCLRSVLLTKKDLLPFSKKS